MRVWISLALFETQLARLQAARAVFTEAFEALKAPELSEQRVMLIEARLLLPSPFHLFLPPPHCPHLPQAWRNFEAEHGTPETQEHVRRNLPQRVKKRRHITGEDGSDMGYEEYWEYLWNDTASSKAGLKLLEAAKKWKREAGKQ